MKIMFTFSCPTFLLILAYFNLVTFSDLFDSGDFRGKMLIIFLISGVHLSYLPPSKQILFLLSSGFMAVFTAGESSHASSDSRRHVSMYEVSERDHSASEWYFTRKEIEENSPSRRDGIDLKKESYLRKSYCTFLQDLGMRLKV